MKHLSRRTVISSALASSALPALSSPAWFLARGLLCAAGGASSRLAQAQEAAAAPPEVVAWLQAALALPHRSAANRARDGARHPLETLLFFGIRPTQSVVELSPGAAWYTEILAPAMRERGHFYAVHSPREGGSEGQRRGRANFEARLAKDPALYDKVVVGSFPSGPAFTDLSIPGGADLVLTFRNVHNWVSDKTLDNKLKACFGLLKPGGVLGVVDHRAAPGSSLAQMDKTGYVTEAFMEERARAAGFVLGAKSEVNANPRDTKDHPNGVWSLPPTFEGGDTDRARFQAIGESDRFTHRYVKPKA
jgi:predicted methyltransferase